MDQSLTPSDQLFAAPFKRRFAVVKLPVSGFTVRIRSLTAGELSAHQASAYAGDDLRVSKARLEDSERRFIALCLADEQGNRLIAATDQAKLAHIRENWDAGDLSYLYNQCRRHVRVEPGDVEGYEKNSGGTPAG